MILIIIIIILISIIITFLSFVVLPCVVDELQC
jgi:hypothetical protein